MIRATLLPVLLAILAGASPAHAWTWPADGPVLQPFRFGDDPYAAGLHRGIDVAAPPGASVRAPRGGLVSFAGTVPGGGRTVTIRTVDGYAVTLVHLGVLLVRAGAAVTEGDAVGTIGPSGTPEHDVPYVHLGVRVAAEPEGYVDPMRFLPPRDTPAPLHEPEGVPVAPPPPAPAAPPAAEAPAVETPAVNAQSGQAAAEPAAALGVATPAAAEPNVAESAAAPAVTEPAAEPGVAEPRVAAPATGAPAAVVPAHEDSAAHPPVGDPAAEPGAAEGVTESTTGEAAADPATGERVSDADAGEPAVDERSHRRAPRRPPEPLPSRPDTRRRRSTCTIRTRSPRRSTPRRRPPPAFRPPRRAARSEPGEAPSRPWARLTSRTP